MPMTINTHHNSLSPVI